MAAESKGYAGTLTIEDRKLQLPEKYADAEKYVVRHIDTTQQYRSGFGGIGWAIWHDLDEHPGDPENPDLELDEVRIKKFGEEPELYRVDSGGCDE